MTQQGKYDPQNPEHSSTLFEYGEAPLSSGKLNRWAGNLQAALDFLTGAAVALFGGDSEDAVLPGWSSEPLLVSEQPAPDMTVTAAAGRCVVAGHFAGIDAAETIPDSGSIPAPVAEDRIDVVCIDRFGSLSLTTGEESTTPSAPAAPGDGLKLAEIYLRPGATVIKNLDDSVNGYIVDSRPRLLSGEAHRPGEDRTPSESPDGLRVNFTTAEVFRGGTLAVFRNGLLQAEGPDMDYTEDSDANGYSFNEPPEFGDIIQHFYTAE